jgi:EAL domain-containing protein (putative c-di-GMP-specific phosphodiesterase class I)
VTTALHDWDDFAAAGARLHAAVNTSVGALASLNLASLIRDNRPESDAWPGLILEVTEGDAVKDVPLMHEIATQLKIYGITLAIDDFGEGYSSFSRLRDMPFAELKLDMSFVKNCANDNKNAAICKAVVDLAHNFGAVAVAEGIDNASDLQAIHRMGCDIGQGFFFARPMPKAEFVSMLQQRANRKLAS